MRLEFHGGLALLTGSFGDHRDAGPSVGAGFWYRPDAESNVWVWPLAVGVRFGT